jgi:hypothetical protein
MRNEQEQSYSSLILLPGSFGRCSERAGKPRPYRGYSVGARFPRPLREQVLSDHGPLSSRLTALCDSGVQPGYRCK